MALKTKKVEDTMLKEYLDKIDRYEYVEDLEQDYGDFLRNFSCRPDRNEYPYPKVGDVIDEDKSVKWNREEVARLRDAYGERVKELNKMKSKIGGAFEDKFIKLLANDNGLSKGVAKLVYAFAYRESHDSGLYAIRGTFEDVAELVNDIKKLEKTKKKDKCNDVDNDNEQDEDYER